VLCDLSFYPIETKKVIFSEIKQTLWKIPPIPKKSF